MIPPGADDSLGGGVFFHAFHLEETAVFDMSIDAAHHETEHADGLDHPAILIPHRHLKPSGPTDSADVALLPYPNEVRRSMIQKAFSAGTASPSSSLSHRRGISFAHPVRIFHGKNKLFLSVDSRPSGP
jgi:hypothetical protein